jgi:hypothetical protein
MSLTEHSFLDFSERTSHIDLDSPCQYDGPKSMKPSTGFNNLITFLGLTPDVVNRHDSGVFCLHHCPNDSNHGWCTNPRHLSFGSPLENTNMIDPSVLSQRVQDGWSPERRQRQGERIVELRGFDLLLTSPSGEQTTVHSCKEGFKVCGTNDRNIRKNLRESGQVYQPKQGRGKGWTIQKL